MLVNKHEKNRQHEKTAHLRGARMAVTLTLTLTPPPPPPPTTTTTTNTDNDNDHDHDHDHNNNDNNNVNNNEQQSTSNKQPPPQQQQQRHQQQARGPTGSHASSHCTFSSVRQLSRPFTGSCFCQGGHPPMHLLLAASCAGGCLGATGCPTPGPLFCQ